MASPVPGPSLPDLVRGLLDLGYEQTATRTLSAINATLSGGLVEQRLTELEAEARRLAAEGKKLEPDNAVLRALLADLEPVLAENGSNISATSTLLQEQAVDAAGQLIRQQALPGLSDADLLQLGIAWNQPDPATVNQLVNFVDSAAWSDEIARYAPRVSGTVANQAIRGFVEGWGALRSAEAIRQVVQTFTIAQANNLMRTLHLQSYRSAAAVFQQANASILRRQIRIAALDDRTCMSCIALHGTEMPIGARVDDHHMGRCTSIVEVVGGPRHDIQSGEDWFNSLDEERQRRIAGPANHAALKAGVISLRDFSKNYSDPVFGEMIREASLKDLLGDSAKNFYSR